MGKDFMLYINDEERKKEYIDLFGRDYIHVKNPFPETVLINNEKRLAYLMDLDALTDEESDKLILHIAAKFNQPIEFVRNGLNLFGVPVLATGTSIVIKDFMRWF